MAYNIKRSINSAVYLLTYFGQHSWCADKKRGKRAA